MVQLKKIIRIRTTTCVGENNFEWGIKTTATMWTIPLRTKVKMKKVPALFLASFLLLAVPVPYVTPSIMTDAPKGSLGFSGKRKQMFTILLNIHSNRNQARQNIFTHQINAFSWSTQWLIFATQNVFNHASVKSKILLTKSLKYIISI